MIDGGLRTKSITKQSQETMPLITVITVVRNGEKTLEETILSVVNQTYANIEYIIVDGASTDGTLDITRKYEDRIDYWMSEPDEGIYYAMNKGLDLSTGDWLLFLGSDDTLYTKTVIADAVQFFKNKNTVYYGNAFFTKTNRIYNGKFSLMKLLSINISHQSIFYPKGIYKNYDYSLRYKLLDDYNYNLRIYGDVDFIYIDMTVANYNEYGRSSKGDNIFKKDKPKIIMQKYGVFCLVCSYFFAFYYRASLYIRKFKMDK